MPLTTHRYDAREERNRRLMKIKVPLQFVREYLKARGWRETHELGCPCGDEDDDDTLDHPIKWLWDHIKRGHEPYFTMCHSWKRQVGRGLLADKENWYGWWIATWNPKKEVFDVKLDDMGIT